MFNIHSLKEQFIKFVGSYQKVEVKEVAELKELQEIFAEVQRCNDSKKLLLIADSERFCILFIIIKLFLAIKLS